MVATYSALGQVLSFGLFGAIVLALSAGYPVAFVLGGVSIAFGVLGSLLGVFDLSFFASLPPRFFTTVANPVLIAVPLFVLMGVILERSNIAEVLLKTMGQVFGSIRGGLGASVVLVGTMLAASTGVVGATVVTMGLLSLPSMLRAGYDPKLATGVICSSGTLGQIIPPSTVLIFLADILQGANAAAAMRQGNFAPDSVSVGDLFMGALIPGLLLSAAYIGWVFVQAIVRPDSAPALRMTAEERRGLGRRVVIALVPPIFLILAVLGSIIFGIATPTEAGSVGAVGALFLTVVKMVADKMAAGASEETIEKRLFSFWVSFIGAMLAVTWLLGAFGLLNLLLLATVGGIALLMSFPDTRARFTRMIPEIALSTTSITAMIFIILLGASTFSLVFSRMGGEAAVADFLQQMPGGFNGALFVVMAIMFVLGFFLDTFEIVFIVVPIAAPVLLSFPDVSPIWLGVMIGVNLQTSFLTPPFGFALFYLRGVAPPSVTTGTIYRGIIPFVGIQSAALFVVWAQPQLTTYLPNLLFRQPVAAAAPVVEEIPGGLDDLLMLQELEEQD